MDELFQQFECVRCGNCCRGPGFVRITQEDATRIARFLNIKLSSFYTQYTMSHGDGELWLLDDENSDCLFLDKNNLCTIHPVKPRQCAEFPASWRTADVALYCEGLNHTRTALRTESPADRSADTDDSPVRLRCDEE
jgi:Fe-S-cluster containining protein